MATTVDINNRWSILNHSTANRDIFSCPLTDIYASPVVPTTNIEFHDNATEAMGVVKKYNEDISIISTNLSSENLTHLSLDNIDINLELVFIMAWRQIRDKSLSEPMPTQFTDAYMRH